MSTHADVLRGHNIFLLKIKAYDIVKSNVLIRICFDSMCSTIYIYNIWKANTRNDILIISKLGQLKIHSIGFE